jgi:hypothetical protein
MPIWLKNSRNSRQKNPLTAAMRKSITRKDEFIKWREQAWSQSFVVDVKMALDGIAGIAVPRCTFHLQNRNTKYHAKNLSDVIEVYENSQNSQNLLDSNILVRYLLLQNRNIVLQCETHGLSGNE